MQSSKVNKINEIPIVEDIEDKFDCMHQPNSIVIQYSSRTTSVGDALIQISSREINFSEKMVSS